MNGNTGSYEDAREHLLKAIADAKTTQDFREKLFAKGLLANFARNAGSHADEVRMLQDLALRRLDELKHEEEVAYQRKVGEWQRVRSGIEHENHLVNHRLTWLFSSQAFLVAAYTLAFNQWAKVKEVDPKAFDLYPYLLAIIALTGILICIVIRRAATGAIVQLKRLDNWWHTKDRTPQNLMKRIELHETQSRQDQITPMLADNPPLQGELRSDWDLFFSSEAIPIHFTMTWSAIILFTVLKAHEPIWDALQTHGKHVLIVLLVVGFGATIWMIGRQRTELSRQRQQIVNLQNQLNDAAAKSSVDPENSGT